MIRYALPMLAVVIWLLVSSGPANSARAELIRVEFDATVTTVGVFEFVSEYATYPWPEVGTSIRGSYVYDSNASNTSSIPDVVGSYTTAAPHGGVRAVADNLEIVALQNRISIQRDSYFMRSLEATSNLQGIFSTPIDRAQVRVVVVEDDLNPDGDLELAPPRLEQGSEGSVIIFLSSSALLAEPLIAINAQIDRLAVVPEPSTLAQAIALAMAVKSLSARAARLGVTA